MGGNVTLDAGKINAPGGRIELGGLSAPGSVEVATEGGSPRLSLPAGVDRSNLALNNQAQVNVAGAGGGDIGINAHNIDLLERSVIRGGIEKNLGAKNAVAGNINLNATSGIVIGNGGGIANNVSTNSLGQAGNIAIEANTIALRKQGGIATFVLGQGDAGSIQLKVTGAIDIDNSSSSIISSVGKSGVGNAGDIFIDTGSLALRDGASIASFMNGKGNSGFISIKALGSVFLSGTESLIANTIGEGGTGNAGNINIVAGSILLQDKAMVSTANLGNGNAGNITVVAKDSINVSAAPNAFFSVVSPGVIGNGGDISIQAESLSLTGGSTLQSSNVGIGDSGDIQVKVRGKLDIVGTTEVAGGGITNFVGTQGNAGNIIVEANSFSLRNGAGLISTNNGQGKSGTINVSATDSIFLSGVKERGFRGLFVTAIGRESTAGNIIVSAPRITLENGFTIDAVSLSGSGGNIFIGNPPRSTTSQSNVSTPTTDLLLLRSGAQISTNARGGNQQRSDGGNINLKSGLIVAIPQENSDITADAITGRGGNVNITAQGVIGTQFSARQTSRSDITASSDFGRNGLVSINTPGIDPSKNTNELPATPTDASRQITQTCNSSQVGNKFYITGRGGHPAISEDSLTENVVWLDPRNPRTPVTNNSSTQFVKRIAQPTVGWVFDGKGKVTLLAASDKRTSHGVAVVCPNQATSPK